MRYLLQEVGISEDGHFVAFLTGYVGDIKEAHVHADAAYDGHLPTVYSNATITIAQMTVEPVGIADRYDGDARRTLRYPATVVANRVAFRNVLELRYLGLETADGLKMALYVGLGGNAIETDAQTDHVHLCLGEAGDARRVEDVTENGFGMG